MNDIAVKRLVEDELEWEPSLNAANICVLVDKGIVTLDGHVGSFAEKVAAGTALKRLQGVRGFVDNLTVQPLGSSLESDQVIADQVAKRIEWDVVVPKGTVKVQVAKGHVTLSGEVEWQFQREAAERGIRELRGVLGVSNEITLKPQASRRDIKHRIEAALNRQADMMADQVRVIVDGDTVRLEGEVDAWSDRTAIENAAWAAPGVSSVDDRITIAGLI